MDNEQTILEAMIRAEKPMRPGEIAKIVGLESREVSKVIKSLRKQGKVIIPKRCYYAPAKE